MIWRTILLLCFLLLPRVTLAFWGWAETVGQTQTCMAGCLALEGQTGFTYYNQTDAPEGAYQVTLPAGVTTRTGTITLPGSLPAGTWYVFFKMIGYDHSPTLTLTAGGATSTTVTADDRDFNAYWTTPSTLISTSAATTATLTITKTEASGNSNTPLLRGLFITNDPQVVVDRYDTVINLNYPTVMDTSAAVKGNIVADSSFEGAVGNEWGWYTAMIPALKDQQSSAEAFHGTKSLRIPLDPSNAQNGNQNPNIISKVYHLKPNKQYTFSIYVKASSGAPSVAMTAMNTFTPPSGFTGQYTFGDFIFASTSWQRLSITGYAVAYPTADFQILIQMPSVAGQYIYLDAFQIEEGTLSTYAPAELLEVGLTATPNANIYHTTDTLTATLGVRNNDTVSRTGTVAYTVYDIMNAIVGQGTVPLSVSAGSTTTSAFTLDVGKIGAFRMLYNVQGERYSQREFNYAVLPPPQVSGVDTASRFGIHPEYWTPLLQRYDRLGVKWGRILSPTAWCRWTNAEPTEGTFVYFDSQLAAGQAIGLSTMCTLGTNNYWPAYADNGGVPYLSKWATFVSTLVGHYDSLGLKYWEIWNEPNSVFTANFYAQMLKTGVDAIEAASASAKIVCFGGVPLSYMQSVITELGILYPSWTWATHCDAAAHHAYPGTDPSPFKAAIIDTYGLPVWNTESGAYDRGGYQANWVAWGRPIFPHQDGVQFYNSFVGTPGLLEDSVLRSLATPLEKYFYYDGRLGASAALFQVHTTLLEYDNTIKPKGILYAATAALLDHSTGLGNVSGNSNSTFLLFDRGATAPIAAMYTPDKQPRQATLSLSTSQFRLRDWMGNISTPASSTVKYGRIPLYIEGVGISTATLQTALAAATIAARSDTDAPHVSIVDAPLGKVPNSAPLRFRWLALDDTSYPNVGELNPENNTPADTPNVAAIQYRYRILGVSSTFSAWDSRVYLDTVLTNGQYTLEVQAKDDAGNISTTAAQAFTVGDPAPSLLRIGNILQ